jgi:signal transduction histidine kinase/ActR/RegA family two-component response regulator
MSRRSRNPWRRKASRLLWKIHHGIKGNIPAGMPADETRCRYAAQLACPFHFISTSPYCILFLLYGKFNLAFLVLPLCLAYGLAWWLLRRGMQSAGAYAIIGSVAASITAFSVLLGRESHLEVALFYCSVAPFLFFPASQTRKILIGNFFPATAWAFLEMYGYNAISPMALTHTQLELFRGLIMPTTAMLLLVPLLFLLRVQTHAEARLVVALDGAEKSNRAKSEFLTLVSHELRTPLNGVLGMLHLLGDSNLGRRQQDDLDTAVSSAELLRKLIDDILSFSRLEKGMTAIVMLAVEPGKLVEQALSNFKNVAQQKGIELTLDIERGIPWVTIDPVRFQQIASDLISNAVKFTDEGSVRAQVTWRPVSERHGRLALEVTDTGIGIPEGLRSSVFKPFTQLHRSVHANASGCGLGLAIAQHLARLMNGEILLDSQEGAGSRFRATFLLETALAPVAKQASLQEDMTKIHNPFCGRVLVVDDVRTNQIVASRLLTSLGFECEVASDGMQAVQLWQEKDFALIFMDLQMPVMDGLDATREIHQRAAFEERERPIILALTANTFDEHRERCRKLGMDGFLEKPVNAGAIRKMLTELLAQRHPEMIADK